MRYFRIFLLHFQEIFAQRSVSFVWFLMSLIAPLLMILFWRGVRTVPGWTYQELTTYYIMVIILGSFILTYIEERVAEEDIHAGQLTMYLLKPFPYIWLKCFHTIPNRLLQGACGLMLFIILLFFSPSLFSFNHSLETIFLSLFVVLAGFALSFIFKMIIGATAFWATDAHGIIEIANAIIVVFGGILMPLTLFPDWLSQVASYLPFSYMVYFPVLVVIGKLTFPEILQGFAMQILWISILFACYKLIWKAGIKKYAAIGQ